jgi:hypothetical protein
VIKERTANGSSGDTPAVVPTTVDVGDTQSCSVVKHLLVDVDNKAVGMI